MRIKDIAKLAKVSTATVSRVINDSPAVSEKTKKRVQEVIKRENYKPNITAQNLAKRTNNIIGVVIPDLENPFFGKIISGIYQEIEDELLNVILLSSNGSLEDEEKIIETLVEQKVRGVIIVPCIQEKQDTKRFEKLDELNIPYVLVDREVQGSEGSKVYLENRKASYSATKYLLQKTRNIAMISGPIKATTAIKRLRGYALAMKEVEASPKVYFGDFQLDSGYKIINEIIESQELPRVLFVANNMMTLGVIKGLIERDINLLKEIEIFSFDEVEMAEIFGVKIGYLKFDVKSIGQNAVNIIKNKLNGDLTTKIIKIPGQVMM